MFSLLMNFKTPPRFRPVSAQDFLQCKNRQRNAFSATLTVLIVAGVRLELTTFGL
jgi:hypothetical protein